LRRKRRVRVARASHLLLLLLLLLLPIRRAVVVDDDDRCGQRRRHHQEKTFFLSTSSGIKSEIANCMATIREIERDQKIQIQAVTNHKMVD
jgi:hypothetical protein